MIALVVVLEAATAPAVMTAAWDGGGRAAADRAELIVAVVFASIASTAAAVIAAPRAWFVAGFLVAVFGALGILDLAWALVESGPVNRVDQSIAVQLGTLLAVVVPFASINTLRRDTRDSSGAATKLRPVRRGTSGA